MPSQQRTRPYHLMMTSDSTHRKGGETASVHDWSTLDNNGSHKDTTTYNIVVYHIHIRGHGDVFFTFIGFTDSNSHAKPLTLVVVRLLGNVVR